MSFRGHLAPQTTRADRRRWLRDGAVCAIPNDQLSQIRAANPQEVSRSLCSNWWVVLGSNQWPLPCETEGRGLRIKDMRGQTPFATGVWYHLMSFDITQCHFRSVPELPQSPRIFRGSNRDGGWGSHRAGSTLLRHPALSAVEQPIMLRLTSRWSLVARGGLVPISRPRVA